MCQVLGVKNSPSRKSLYFFKFMCNAQISGWGLGKKTDLPFFCWKNCAFKNILIDLVSPYQSNYFIRLNKQIHGQPIVQCLGPQIQFFFKSPILDARIFVCLFVCSFVHPSSGSGDPPPGFWNGQYWRALVKCRPLNIEN